MKIYFGEWKTDTDPDCNEDEDPNEDCDDSDYSDENVCYPDCVADISPKKFTIHPEYLNNRESHLKSAYDIAIIELMRPPRETKITQSIKLPDSETCDDDLDGSMLVTGFGKILSIPYLSLYLYLPLPYHRPYFRCVSQGYE